MTKRNQARDESTRGGDQFGITLIELLSKVSESMPALNAIAAVIASQEPVDASAMQDRLQRAETDLREAARQVLAASKTLKDLAVELEFAAKNILETGSGY